ncbi:hypothetical protein PoB_005041700 [Plakobranchus ocellatus]|uniref:Uncharacterized protein n=1 Tax=Plakobranchus ocellatus TaxID=259542 RepID=A0AAV4BXZ2_9GAST|nr:hypothetical protein PoB_005041700 [Plakobranchus ocellatus]
MFTVVVNNPPCSPPPVGVVLQWWRFFPIGRRLRCVHLISVDPLTISSQKRHHTQCKPGVPPQLVDTDSVSRNLTDQNHETDSVRLGFAGAEYKLYKDHKR